MGIPLEWSVIMLFRNRSHAGRLLARELGRFRADAPIVLGLPRGGVVVAYEVAQALQAPLDVWVVRKLGAPFQPELGMGAVAEGGEVFLDPSVARAVGATGEEIREVQEEQEREVERRIVRFRGSRPRPDLGGKTVLVVDDGIATGGTVRAALRAIRKTGPSRLVLATPVASAHTLASLNDEADEIVCLHAPWDFAAIGQFYADFRQTSDDEVVELLRAARETHEAREAELARAPTGPHAPPQAAARPRRPEAQEREVTVVSGGVELPGTLKVPAGAAGLVLFAHGSGSSRSSPRNRYVAGVLEAAGLGTLLFDLLTRREEQEEQYTRHLRFDIRLLAERLAGATDWVLSRPETGGMSIGYFGASTGAAAALVAAAMRSGDVQAIVSRGGRPDLAEDHLPLVRAPTLLIVGSEDTEVLELNEDAYRRIRAPKHLAVVRGATHLFEEPGTLEEVARLAAEWFERHLAPRAVRAAG